MGFQNFNSGFRWVYNFVKIVDRVFEVLQQNVKWCGGIHGVSKMFRGLQKASKNVLT